jgi:hypothetical protein
MRIGEMFLGRVDGQGAQSVQTKFFVLGVPLFPTESFWSTQDTGNGVIGFPIPLHGKSVGFGYLRIYSWLGALLAGISAYIEHRSYDPQYGLFGLAAVCLVLAIVSTFVLGGVDAAEQKRRALLHRLTGLYAPPEILSPEKRDDIAAALQRAWVKVSPEAAWTARIDSGKATAAELPLLYAIARYELDANRATSAARALSL